MFLARRQVTRRDKVIEILTLPFNESILQQVGEQLASDSRLQRLESLVHKLVNYGAAIHLHTDDGNCTELKTALTVWSTKADPLLNLITQRYRFRFQQTSASQKQTYISVKSFTFKNISTESSTPSLKQQQSSQHDYTLYKSLTFKQKSLQVKVETYCKLSFLINRSATQEALPLTGSGVTRDYVAQYQDIVVVRRAWWKVRTKNKKKHCQ